MPIIRLTGKQVPGDTWKNVENKFGFQPIGRKEKKTTFPPLLIRETDTEVIVSALVAGMDAEDVEISWVKNSLYIQGTKTKEYTNQEVTYQRKEIFEGPFNRKINLMVDVDESKLTGSMVDGILTIKLPKQVGNKSQVIPVRSFE